MSYYTILYSTILSGTVLKSDPGLPGLRWRALARTIGFAIHVGPVARGAGAIKLRAMGLGR